MSVLFWEDVFGATACWNNDGDDAAAFFFAEVAMAPSISKPASSSSSAKPNLLRYSNRPPCQKVCSYFVVTLGVCPAWCETTVVGSGAPRCSNLGDLSCKDGARRRIMSVLLPPPSLVGMIARVPSCMPVSVV